MHLAIELGHDKIVARLLAKDPHLICEEGHYSLSCLHLATIKGHITIVKQLLAIKPSLMTNLDRRERSALHFAVEYGHEEIVSMLMANVNETLFHSAIRSGHDHIVGLLLARCPQLIDAADKYGEALDFAANHKRHTIVARLLAHKPHSIDIGNGRSLLGFAAMHGYDTVVSRLLTEHPHLADDAGSSNHMSALHFAAEYGYDTIVEKLLAHNPHLIDGKHYLDKNALHFAAHGGHDRVVARLLVVKPALASQTDHEGRTALHIAAREDREKVVEQLLAHSPELLDMVDRTGCTALYWASRRGSVRAVASLLAHGPTVDDDVFWTVVRSDVECRDQVVKLLLAHKPELAESVDRISGLTVLHRVFGGIKRFSEEIVRMVWEMSPPGALHKLLRDSFQTPFHVAIWHDNRFAMELVLGKLSLEEVMSAFIMCKRECPLYLLDKFRECLSVSLNQDVVGTVGEYLGCEGLAKRTNKRMRSDNEE